MDERLYSRNFLILEAGLVFECGNFSTTSTASKSFLFISIQIVHQFAKGS